MRGLEGQKLRGYSTGESVYGYKSHPVGELKLNKKGQPKYEGMIHKINDEEALIIKRIYKEFIEGKSIHSIVKGLNEDKMPTKKNRIGGWATSTVTRILKNEKYTGRWVWRKSKNVRDPMTGKTKKIARPEKEQIDLFKEDLVIINQNTWDETQKRWKTLDGAWPMHKKTKKTSKKPISYIHSNPTHLLAGLLKCKSCGGSIVQICGKSGGYYGCYNAKRKTCTNKLTIQRKRLEAILIENLKEKFLTAENIKYIFDNVEKTIGKSLNEVPKEVKQKKAQMEKIQSELQNLLNFIKAGNFSKLVSDAIVDSETRQGKLQGEIQALDYQRTNAFKAPPKEWIEFRLERFQETLNKNTKASALALKELLGTIELEPIKDDCIVENGRLIESKPYYLAHSNIASLALLDQEHKSTNWYLLRREWDSNPRYALTHTRFPSVLLKPLGHPSMK
jgi:site-specific DNA recombinase